MINATDLVCGERFIMKRKKAVETLVGFWIVKAVVALLTLGMMGAMISAPTVLVWEAIFNAICVEDTAFAEFFISSFSVGAGLDFAELAVNYLRIGLLEMPIVIGVNCLIAATEEKEAAKANA